MTRSKRIPRPSAHIIAQRPRLAAETSRTNNRLDEFEAQNDWQARIDSGVITVTR